MVSHSTTSSAILNQLVEVITQLNNEQYTMPVNILSGNSIGKHIRHIVEFYQCLSFGYPDGIVDYDKRNRNIEIETNVNTALESIKAIKHFVINASNKPLKLFTIYPGREEGIVSESSFSREVVYNIEHAIHHMAIIKIAILASFPQIVLPQNFGVAYSTLQYMNDQCAQ